MRKERTYKRWTPTEYKDKVRRRRVKEPKNIPPFSQGAASKGRYLVRDGQIVTGDGEPE